MDVTFQMENQLNLKEEETTPQKARKSTPQKARRPTPQKAGKTCGLKAVSARVASGSQVCNETVWDLLLQIFLFLSFYQAESYSRRFKCTDSKLKFPGSQSFLSKLTGLIDTQSRH